MFSGSFIGEGYDSFWNGALFTLGSNILEQAHHIAWTDIVGKWLPTIMMAAGFITAYLFYRRYKDLPDRMANFFLFRPFYLLFYNKWYFDELYNVTLVKPAMWIGRLLWKVGDGKIIDGLGPDGVAALTMWWGKQARKLQTGYIYHYAFAMLIGVALAVTYFMFREGGV